jgi:SAM-dependent methyltransferase
VQDSSLTLRTVLDPRPPAQANASPLPGAVHIPLAELPRRVHELPPADVELPIAGPPALVADVIVWLAAGGRRARPARPDELADAARPTGPGRLWRPNPLLEVCLPQLRGRTALDVGCGTGRDAVFLASCGWHVTAVDVLPDAVARGRDLASRYTGRLAPITWQAADAACPTWQATPHDLVLALRLADERILVRLADWVAPGGSVLCETFTPMHHARHGRPAHALAAAALRDRVLGADAGAAWHVHRCEEAWRGLRHTAWLWAQRRSNG